jgi:transposase-like protein
MCKATTEQSGKQQPDLDWYFKQPRVTQLTLLSNYLELALLTFNQLIKEEVESLAGKRYRRDKPHEGRYHRWGWNPGSIRLGPQRVSVNVPRVYDTVAKQHRSLDSYTTMQEIAQPNEAVLQAILRGLGTRNYDKVVETLTESFGLSKSQISETFKEESAEALRAFIERRFDDETFVSLLLDGKSQQGAQIVIALGVTREGRKIPLGFVQATTENAASCSELLRDLLRRGLTYEDGLLVVIDGAKGLHKAVEDVFGVYAVIGRCQFHKRRNIVSYLPESEQSNWNRRVRAAMAIDTIPEARKALESCRDELRNINVSAATSLEEGIEEYLTLQRLGISAVFHQTFSTTNCIENLNSLIGRYTRHVTRWSTSDQRHRWIASALLEAEQNMRRIPNADKLPLLQAAVAAEVKRRLNEQTIHSFTTPNTSPFPTKKRA